MTADQSNIYLNIKGIHVRDIKLSNKSFGMDVFGTEQKILVLFHAMSPVVIRAIAPVTDKDILGARQRGVPVYHSQKARNSSFCRTGWTSASV